MLKREKYDLESYSYRIESIVLSIKGVSLFARLTLIKYFWKGILYYLNNLLNILTECSPRDGIRQHSGVNYGS